MHALRADKRVRKSPARRTSAVGMQVAVDGAAVRTLHDKFAVTATRAHTGVRNSTKSEVGCACVFTQMRLYIPVNVRTQALGKVPRMHTPYNSASRD